MMGKGRRTALVAAALAAAVAAAAAWSLRWTALEAWLVFRLDRLGAGDEIEFRRIAGRLRELGSPGAIEPLLERLRSRDPWSRREWKEEEIVLAVEAAGRRGAPHLERFLLKSARDHPLRIWAAIRLTAIRPGDPAARAVIIEAIGDGSGADGLSALQALESEGADVRPILIEVLEKVPAAAAWACGRLEETGPDAAAAVPALRRMEDRGGPAIRTAAAAALAAIAGPGAFEENLPALIAGLGDAGSRPAALRGIGSLREEAFEALPHLLAILQTRPEEEREGVLETAVRLGPEARQAVRDLAEEDRIAIPLDLGRRLAGICGRPSLDWIVPAVARTVRAAGVPREEVLRRTEAILLEGIAAPPPEDPAGLIVRLQDSDPGTALLAARCLGWMGPEARAAVPALEELRRSRRREIREAAGDALGLIREDR